MQEQHGRTCCVLVNQLARSNPPPFFGFESWETVQSWKPLSLNAAQGTSPNRFLEDSQLSAWSFCSAVSAVRQVRPQGVIINVSPWALMDFPRLFSCVFISNYRFEFNCWQNVALELLFFDEVVFCETFDKILQRSLQS